MQPTLEGSVPQVGAPQAWAAGFTCTGATVAVLDSGYDANHPDLGGAVVASRDFTGEGIADTSGHGTHVASTNRRHRRRLRRASQGCRARLLIGKVLGEFERGAALMLSNINPLIGSPPGTVLAMPVVLVFNFTDLAEAVARLANGPVTTTTVGRGNSPVAYFVADKVTGIPDGPAFRFTREDMGVIDRELVDTLPDKRYRFQFANWSYGGFAGGAEVELDWPHRRTDYVTAGAALPLKGGLTVATQPGAKTSKMRWVAVEVSYDEGATWRKATVGREGDRFEVRIPAGGVAGGYASLRATATDSAGNRVTETVTRAYALR